MSDMRPAWDGVTYISSVIRVDGVLNVFVVVQSLEIVPVIVEQVGASRLVIHPERIFKTSAQRIDHDVLQSAPLANIITQKFARIYTNKGSFGNSSRREHPCRKNDTTTQREK